MTKYVSCEASECDSVTAWGSEEWILEWIETERAEVKLDFCSWQCVAAYADEMSA